MGVNYSKSQNLHHVTYENKGFDSLIKKINEKNKIWGPRTLLELKIGIRGDLWGV